MGEKSGDRHYVPITTGSPSFRTMEAGDFKVTDAWFPAGEYLERHAHERRVLAVMLDGSFDLVFHGRRLDCSPSTVFTEPGGESHANAIGSGGARVLVLQPSNDMELEGPCSLMLDRINHFRDGVLAGLARNLGRELREPDDVTGLAIQALALEMLVRCARRIEAGRDDRAPPSWFRRVEEIVHDRFRDGLRIDGLAEAAGVHPAHVARVFREQYGVPVGTFIRRLRLEWATTQLVCSDMPISTIAYRAGFADQSHFTRAFRRARGVPPGRYRSARRP